MGFRMMVWTVDGPHRLRAYLADGRVAGIITDLPGLAVETRRELQSGPVGKWSEGPIRIPARGEQGDFDASGRNRTNSGHVD